MKSIEIVPLAQPIVSCVLLPGSLSYTVRALNIAAMTEGTVVIRNALISDDTEAMISALETLGIALKRSGTTITVAGSVKDVKNKEYSIDIHISGRTARSLLGLLCLTPGTKILTCAKGFKKRPVGGLVDGLIQLGASIIYLENENYLPVKILPAQLTAGVVKMRGNISSQFFSSIMMIAPLVGEITIQVEGRQTSKSFIDVTVEIMEAFGVRVQNHDYQEYRIAGNQHYSPIGITIEPDAIAAGYFWGIAAVTGSTIKVLNLPPKSKQGDTAFADALARMGCDLEKNETERWVSIRGPAKLSAISIDMNSMPDSAQTLAVVAAFAEGITEINGLDNLRIKETDRIAAPQNELKKMGILVAASESGMTIQGGNPHMAEIETYGDHRMAMSFAVAGAKIPGIKMNDPGVVSKSFPGFWKVLRQLGVNTI